MSAIVLLVVGLLAFLTGILIYSRFIAGQGVQARSRLRDAGARVP